MYAYAAKQNALLALVNKPGNERLRNKTDNIADSKYYADLIVGITFKLQKYGRKAKKQKQHSLPSMTFAKKRIVDIKLFYLTGS